MPVNLPISDIAICAACFIGLALAALKSRKNKAPRPLGTTPNTNFPSPVYRRKPLMSRWESNFYEEITKRIPTPFVCFTQVRYADFLLADNRYTREEQFELNKKIFGKSADFVIYNTKTGNVVLVYELNDKSHEMTHRRDRDAMIQNALHSADIPLITVKPHQRRDIISDLRSAGAR